MDYEKNRIITQEELDKMGEELSNCAESLIDQQFKKISNDMDYEKKYKEALEKARQLCAYPTTKPFISDLQDLFPELAESEDERIRKELIEHVKDQQSTFISAPDCRDKYEEEENNKYNAWIAWLEKQGSQNNTEDEDLLYRFCFYSYKDESNILYLSGLYVNGECRNKGIGTKILEVADEVAKNLNCYAIRLKTKIGSNAERLYRRNGYNTLIKEGNQIWLEKQGEQNDSDVKDYNSIDPHFGKPIDKVEPKFKVGDWVVWDNKISCHIDNIYQGKESLMYTITDAQNMTRSYSVKGFDNNAHLWTINDARDGDVLTDGGYPCIFKSINEGNSMFVYCGIKGNRNFATKADSEDNIWDDEPENYCPATKEQRDTLFAKMKESGYKWNAEKKELEKIEDEEYNGEDYGIDGLWHAMNILEKTLGKVSGYQTDDGFLSHQCAITSVKKLYKQKPDWGEEDERIYQSIIDDTVQDNQLDSKQIDWLKSIKSRVQPKQE